MTDPYNEPMVDVVWKDVHSYWSTHCRHLNHTACQATEIAPRVPRRPAQCKTCGAPCRCTCHGRLQRDMAPYDPVQINAVARLLADMLGLIPLDVRNQAAAAALDYVEDWIHGSKPK